MSILSEIDKWKLDAKLEENKRYFFHVAKLSDIQEGEKCYVIGRKGSGKTAISESLFGNRGYNCFTEKLTFKNFPFNDLYRMENSAYTRPNQYITLWKLLIYGTVCRMMVRNQNIDVEVRNTLEKVFGGTDSIKNLRRSIKNWTGKEYAINIMGTGGKIALEKSDNVTQEQSWIDRVDILEDVLLGHLDECKYYVLFDELDEDYKAVVDMGDQGDYEQLITSLFKAVQDVRSVFRNSGKNIFPVVFLRDDIYSLLLDSDKTKWKDFIVSLDWDAIKIKKMIAFRISRAINPNGKVLPFKEAWLTVFTNERVGVGTRKRRKIPIFDFMTHSTQMRPRDYVRYLQVAAHEAMERGKLKISAYVVKKVDKGFSNYLRDELVDEIHGRIQDIQEILSVISEIRKQVFTIHEFKSMYLKRVKSGILVKRDPDSVLRTLFEFSVIGNSPRPGISFFRYHNKEAKFNFNENIIVHRGLFKALQIL